MISNEDSKLQKFYDNENNVIEFIESCEGKDGKFLIEMLKNHLAKNSTVLELGIGAGFDLDILNQNFIATGSDYSQVFLDIYKQKNKTTDLLLLDARTLKTHRKFDCIYSNKVLHHLTKKELIESFQLQKQRLKPKGILFHSFWHGDKKNSFQDLRFSQYKISELADLTKNDYKLVEIGTYKELLKNDSIYLTLRTI